MVCNCNNNINNSDDTLIQFIAGTSFSVTVTFDSDISTYTNAVFSIRKNYDTEPVINKTISISDSASLDINLLPSETAQFNSFINGKDSATYIWGLDLIDTNANVVVNVFPLTGNPAPLCIVYKHVVKEN